MAIVADHKCINLIYIQNNDCVLRSVKQWFKGKYGSNIGSYKFCAESEGAVIIIFIHQEDHEK